MTSFAFVRSNFPWAHLEPLDDVDEAFKRWLPPGLSPHAVEERLRVARLQRWLTTIGYPVTADGIVGPKTLAALDKQSPDGFSFDTVVMCAIERALPRAVGYAQDRPVIRVRHASLERTGDSPFRSRCPECHRGVLMVYRTQEEPYALRREDCCVWCAQRFYYLDAEIGGEPLPHEGN